VIKCVIWDLDNTLLDGVFLESPDQPPPANPRLAGLLHELGRRGILHAIASRNPPEAGQYAERVTGHSFAATRCDWGTKSAAIHAIMAELGLTADSVAFTDDDPLERAEVSFSLPDVLVLAPEDMSAAAGWPQFSPAVVTDEARRRGELYRQRRLRQEEARAFGGSRDEFLLHSQTRVAIGPATAEDLPRLHELSVRTHQFNSTGTAVSEAEFASLFASSAHQVLAVTLADMFGDDGLVGGCVLETGSSWQVPLLMMSCRALGRGVIDALLTWICRAARQAGAARVALPCLISPRNVPLRIALTGAGFRVDGVPGQDAAADAGASRSAVYTKDLAKPLPELPSWVVQ
jgi:methoxymalonate biosynthesis protein